MSLSQWFRPLIRGRQVKRARRSRWHRCATESLETRCVLDSVVVFSELMYHPADNDLRGEWIELRNLLSVDVDLSDWSLQGGIDYQFPTGSTIAADGYLLVAADTGAWPDAAPAPVLGPWDGALDNSGERVELRNNSDRLMDEVRYEDDSPWPVAADGAGPSLAKRETYWTSTDASNWEPSFRVGGTPGLANTPNIDLTPRSTEVLATDASWRYEASGVDLGDAWRSVNFDDTNWPQGEATFFAGVQQAGADQLRLMAIDGSGDADLSGSKTYTHAVDFGKLDEGADVNGLRFANVTSSGIPQVSNLQWSHSSGIRTNGKPADAIPLSGPLADLYQDYVANSLNLPDGTVQLVLTGLVPGVRYATRLYGRRADSSPRNVTLEFDSGGTPQSITLDQNAPPIADPNGPYVIEFEFKAISDQLSIMATQRDGTKPWYWYGLTNEVVQLTGETELSLGPPTHYFRTTFNSSGDVAADRELRLRLNVDDGAAVYLNGSEIYRDNLPAGNIDFSTRAISDIDTGQQRDVVTLPAGLLNVVGANTLAVEVHQAAGVDGDLRFGAELTVVETPRPTIQPPEVLLNEVPAADVASRWIELVNRDDRSVNLNELWLEVQDDDRRAIPLPNQVLAPLEVISVPVLVSWSVGDRIVLYTQDRSTVVDAQVVDKVDQARSWNHDARWLRPERLTPGATNAFVLSDQIVINEIMYNAAPQYATQDVAYRETPDEWIELYNRGSTAADVSGWELDGGIDFEFNAGTIIPSGGYLVVSNDADRLRQQWPDAAILGNFSGKLSNKGEPIVLQDAFGNPADEVEYFDDGAWPSLADGGGSSLELRDPNADNAQAGSWAASREEDKGEWVTVSYEGRARSPRGSSDPSEWNELILGLLDSGEVLLDDISVIEDPEGAAIERVQNGGFDEDANLWRFLGTHGQHGRTRVIPDPDDPSNSVLRLVATGAAEHMNNQVETTFLNNARISSSKTYRISFRARWLAGSPQIQSRLYFNRLAAVTVLPIPERAGTPGQPNSQRVDNLGPSFSDLVHAPVVPASGEPVTVSVSVGDVDGLDEVQLYFAEDGKPWQSVLMQPTDDNRYSGIVPGFATGRIVQFYVQATDDRGAVSQFPAGGADSRALYRVNDRAATDGPRHNLRIIMTDDDLGEQFTRTNFTSNERMGATVIWQESQVYYNVEVRLKGSGFSRGSGATGFNLRFGPDRLLFGEHDAVSIDRQGGPWGIGASHREMTIKLIANRAGNIPMMYDDIINLIGPRDSLNGSAQLLTARYDDVFLDSQFEDGSKGTRFKFELIYYSTLTVDGDPESLKLPPSSSRTGVFPVRGIDMPDMGDDPNAYRWNYLIRNNRGRDDYSQIIAMTKALRLSDRSIGGALDVATQQVMDIDQWMRLFAFESLAGINDTFNQGLPHNLQLYVRPSDQRVLAFPWDMDFALHQSTSMSIYGTGSRLSRVINIPTNRRVFQQHLWDIMQTSYSEEYLGPWVRHLATRAQQNNTSEILSYVRRRRAYVLSRLAPKIPFEITTPGKDQLDVDTPHVTLDGTGWIDVREVRLAGQSRPLPVRWLDEDRWQVIVPLQQGTQTLDLEAFDLRGNSVGTASATVTTSAASPLIESLRVTELNYHPYDVTADERAAGWADSEAFEFVELTNVGAIELDLNGVRFVRDMPDGSRSGIGFDFPDVQLAAGESIVITQNSVAFAARYGTQIDPLGDYTGRLSNGGEQLTLVGPGGELLQQFTFDDKWYPGTDGGGTSLEVRSPETASPGSYSQPSAWASSRERGGNPGRALLVDFNEDGSLDAQDIDLFCAALQAQDLAFDLNGDQQVDEQDLDALIGSAMQSLIGDANLDGKFDSSDIIRVFQAGQYEDDIEDNSGWANGDWNCDGDFTSADLIFALQKSGWENG